jgi:hypothetical protein
VQISGISRAVPARTRGVSRSSRTLGRDAVDAWRDGRSALGADGEVVWFWRPDAGVKFRDNASHCARRRRQQSPVSGKSAKETVKTIRVRECRVIPARPAVTNSCVLFYTRGCGCARHPAFPAPCFGQRMMNGPAAFAARGCRGVSHTGTTTPEWRHSGAMRKASNPESIPPSIPAARWIPGSHLTVRPGMTTGGTLNYTATCV